MADKAKIDGSIFLPEDATNRTIEVIEDRSSERGGLLLGVGPLDQHVKPRITAGMVTAFLGYTSNGKSLLMKAGARTHAEMLRDLGEYDHCIVTCTWEQSIEEEVAQDLAYMAVIDAGKLLGGDITPAQLEKIKSLASKRKTLPWILIGHSIKDKERRPRLSMPEVWTAFELLFDKYHLRPILGVIDYLQRIRRVGKGEMREQFIQIVDDVVDLGIGFNLPLYLGAQGKRELKSRAWGVPNTDDGQETSNLEQSSFKMVGTWMPKNDYPIGTILEYGSQKILVTENLLIASIIKQKYGPAPRMVLLEVDYETGKIYACNLEKMKDEIKLLQEEDEKKNKAAQMRGRTGRKSW